MRPHERSCDERRREPRAPTASFYASSIDEIVQRYRDGAGDQVSGSAANQRANACHGAVFVNPNSAGICASTKTASAAGKTQRPARAALRRSMKISASITRSVSPKVTHW
jgi:hypothetical protein